jgi:tRNA U34 5-carboxymethylaminomethyl modifying enzyme MnmG/GidA
MQGRATDAAAIQYRMLNVSKGPAVRGPRCQVDRLLYKQAMQAALQQVSGLEIVDGAVSNVILEQRNGKGTPSVAGVVLSSGAVCPALKRYFTSGENEGCMRKACLAIGRSVVAAARKEGMHFVIPAALAGIFLSSGMVCPIFMSTLTLHVRL